LAKIKTLGVKYSLSLKNKNNPLYDKVFEMLNMKLEMTALFTAIIVQD